jgi:hypothetical protein
MKTKRTFARISSLARYLREGGIFTTLNAFSASQRTFSLRLQGYSRVYIWFPLCWLPGLRFISYSFRVYEPEKGRKADEEKKLFSWLLSGQKSLFFHRSLGPFSSRKSLHAISFRFMLAFLPLTRRWMKEKR